MPRPTPAPATPARSCLSRQWTFGYGSLVHIESLARFLSPHGLALGAHRHETLIGYRRAWSVAMDNTQTVASYKYFIDAETGERPGFVAFANIEHDEKAKVSGLLFEAGDRMLEIFDGHERNYLRTDVTSRIATAVEGTVWSYIGTPQANARYHAGLQTSALVVDKAYVDLIAAAFADVSLPYEAQLPRQVRVVELKRVET